MTASIRFYTEILGMEVVSRLEGTPPTWGQVVTLRSPGTAQLLELNWYEPGSRFGPTYANGEELDHLAFECENVSKEVERLQRLGVEVVIRPREIGGWNEAFVKDPDGIWIELIPHQHVPKSTA